MNYLILILILGSLALGHAQTLNKNLDDSTEAELRHIRLRWKNVVNMARTETLGSDITKVLFDYGYQYDIIKHRDNKVELLYKYIYYWGDDRNQDKKVTPKPIKGINPRQIKFSFTKIDNNWLLEAISIENKIQCFTDNQLAQAKGDIQSGFNFKTARELDDWLQNKKVSVP